MSIAPLPFAFLPRSGGTPAASYTTWLTPSGEFVMTASPATEGDLTAESPLFPIPRIFLPPPVRVYSDPNLIPASESERRVVSMRHGDISTFRRDAEVDLREIRFIHTLSEGRAGALVAEKVDLMRQRLAMWRSEGGPEDDPRALLAFLTRGNRSGARDQIMVGRLRDEGDFYLLNGHRRIAALCALASSGKIPTAWLTRLPVWLHEISNWEAVQSITACTMLNSDHVLSEIVCGDIRPALALRLLERLPRRTAVVKPLPLARGMWLTASDHRHFLDLAERGGVDASFSQAFLLELLWIADRKSQQPANYDPFLERIERLPHLHGKILGIATSFWPLFRELAVPLHRTDPDGVTRHLKALLDTETVTRNLLAEIHIVAKRLNEMSLIADLKRFRYHQAPHVREYALSQAFGDPPGLYASILHHATRSERDRHVLDRIELALQRLMDSFGPGVRREEWGTPELWIEIAFWLRRAKYEAQAERAHRIAENVASAGLPHTAIK